MKNKYKNLENKGTNTIYAAFGILIITLGLTIISCPVSAMMDPSAVYCDALGYKFVTEQTEKGERGLCELPNNQTVDSWAFLKGRVALNWSYCAKEGYKAKHVEDSEICKSCTVCILPNGTEIKVTDLMNLSFIAETCGDGTCGLFENFKTCPKDCPSGELDEYCDGVEDGKCDPDCVESGDDDPDCPAPAPTPSFVPIALAVVIILVAITVLAILLRRHKKEE